MEASHLFHEIVRHELQRDPSSVRILDFGCGAGGVVREFLSLGYDAYGCDIGSDWPDDSGAWQRGLPAAEWNASGEARLKPIAARPYRLPFETGSFDVVVSTQVFEHVQNKEEAFTELSRVLKPDGFGIHLIPSKWRFIEPHLGVPLVSTMWPNVPYWWLALWALLGIRNEFQKGLPWREVAAINHAYCRDGIHYWRLYRYRALFRQIFGDFVSFEELRLRVDRGTAARAINRLRLRWLVAPMRSLFRESCIGHHNVHDV